MAQQKSQLLEADESLFEADESLFEPDEPDIPATTPVTPRVTTPTARPVAPPVVQQPVEEPGMLESFWNTISSPLTTAPSRVAGAIANFIDRPQAPVDYFEDDSFLGGLENFGNEMRAKLAGFGAGSIQAIGDMASQLTSPMDLTAAALSGGSSLAARQGLKTPARLMNIGSRLASAPVAAHGAQTLYNAESPADIATGLMELGGGATGIAQGMPNVIDDVINPPVTTPSVTPAITPDVPSVPKLDKRPMRERIAEIEALPDELPPVTPQQELIPEAPLEELTRDSDFFAKNRPAETTAPIAPVTPQKTIYVKPGPTAVDTMKKAVESGYEHAGLDERGRVKMVYTGKPQKVGVLETEVRNQRGGRSSNKPKDESSALTEVINFPRAIMASMDLSAPLRQGLPLIHRKEFWTSLDDMFSAFKSEDSYRAIMEDITNGKDYKALFGKRRGVDPKTGKPIELDSYADQAGLKLSNLDEGLTAREEALQSKWAEMIPGVRRSNRAYTVFLNKLRADTFKSLVENNKIFSPGSQANTELAKELANFVNTASGRGSLGKLESSAKFLNGALFAPRLIASRLQMLNPHYYWAASPQVRKEALKSLLAVVGTGTGLGQLAKLAGAEVHGNPTSADFGKIKIGNTRIDPFAGFQQYAVLAARLMRGEVESTTTGNTYKLGEKFGRPTRLDILGRFVEGKANPIVSFVTGLLRGKDFVGKPFDIPEEMAARLIPIYMQDLKEILTENPNLVPFYHDEGLMPEGLHPENLPLAVPPAFGMGLQQYGTMK